MKSKSRCKHLSLKKVTVAHLNLSEMRIAKGGCATASLELECSTFLLPCLSIEKQSVNTCSA